MKVCDRWAARRAAEAPVEPEGVRLAVALCAREDARHAEDSDATAGPGEDARCHDRRAAGPERGIGFGQASCRSLVVSDATPRADRLTAAGGDEQEFPSAALDGKAELASSRLDHALRAKGRRGSVAPHALGRSVIPWTDESVVWLCPAPANVRGSVPEKGGSQETTVGLCNLGSKGGRTSREASGGSLRALGFSSIRGYSNVRWTVRSG